MRRVPHPGFFCLGGTLLIARRCWLAGNVIVLPHHAAEAFNRADRRFAALLPPRLGVHRRASLRSGDLDHGVVLALARMVLVARDEQKSMLVPIGEQPDARDLSALIDR